MEMELEEAVQILKESEVMDVQTTNCNLNLCDYELAMEIVLYTLQNSIPKDEIEKLIKKKSINMSGYEYILIEDIKELLEDK